MPETSVSCTIACRASHIFVHQELQEHATPRGVRGAYQLNGDRGASLLARVVSYRRNKLVASFMRSPLIVLGNNEGIGNVSPGFCFSTGSPAIVATLD